MAVRTVTRAAALRRRNETSSRASTPTKGLVTAEESIVEMSPLRLLIWDEISPAHQEGNQYIQTGYRPAASSVKECYQSWGYLHNETVNIYSHVIGAILFALLPIILLASEIPSRWSIATPGDIVVFSIWFFGITACFVLSTVFHTVLNHASEKVIQTGIQLDFQGILLLMWGATVPMIYYGFACDPRLRWVYWGVQTGLALLASIFTFQPRFRDPHLKPLRAATFGSFALSSFVPVVHAVARYGWAIQAKRMGLYWVIAVMCFNTAGAAAYALRFPEKWYPRRFDIFGSSHQLLHVAVVVAGLAHAMGVLQAFDFLHSRGDTCRLR